MPEDKDKKILTDDDRNNALLKLKTLLKDDDKFSKLQTKNSHLETFLYGTDFNVEAALNKIKDYYEMVFQHPDFFPVLGSRDKKSIIDKNIRIILPQYDKEGRVILISKMGNINTSTMKLSDIIEVDDIFLESVLASNPRIAEKGICLIIDAANYPWSILKWMTPECIKLCVKKMMVLPFKDFKFHLVNTSMVIHIAIKITWPLLPAHVKEMIKFHFNDLNSLYQHVDKEVLPPEYGGSYTVNYNELHEMLYERNEEILAYTKFRREVAFN